MAAPAAKIEGMSGRAQKVLDDALDLSDEERAEVAFELVASLDGPADPGAEAAWAAEIDRRARSVHADPEGGQDWQAARAEIEMKLRRR
jgi:putative addiction module component (TIGR02574 family)